MNDGDDGFPKPPGNIHGEPRLPPQSAREPDHFPPPSEGHITDGVSQIGGSTGKYSEINPYTSELSIFKAQEFAKLDRVTAGDFFECTSTVDHEVRYIRKAFVESMVQHDKGTIVRTFSGDFHIVKERRLDLMRKLDSRQRHAFETHDIGLLETQCRELKRDVERLEVLAEEVKRRIERLEEEEDA